MIVVDTSALMAVALEEPAASACRDALDGAGQIFISSGTLTETLIIAARRNVRGSIHRMVEGLAFQIIDVTPASAQRAAEAYDRWGKGIHPAGLNMGDCFAYELAKTKGCPLLYIGDDFARTDIDSVLPHNRPA